MFGFQEPASVLFSILNFYAHVMMYRKFRREIKSSMPMSLVWTYFTVVSINYLVEFSKYLITIKKNL